MDAGQLYGRGIAFPPRIGPDGRWAWSEGGDNVREAIQIILLTEPGERLMLDSFGGGLRRFLFEPNTPASRRLTEERIRNALRLWEPRADIQDLRVDPDPDDPQGVLVTLSYRLVATQATEQIRLALNVGTTG